MNASKYIFIAIIGLFSAKAALGQAKDDGSPIQNELSKSVQLFPNPATEFVAIKFDTPTAKKFSYTVHNIIGNEIGLEPEIVDDFEARIKVKDIHEGYYFLTIQNLQSGQKSTFRFLKR